MLLYYATFPTALTPRDWTRFGPGFGLAAVMVDLFHETEPSEFSPLLARMREQVGDLPLWVGFSVDDKANRRTLCDPDDAEAVSALLSRCEAFGQAAAAVQAERIVVEVESFAATPWPAHPGWERLGRQLGEALGPLPLAAEDALQRVEYYCAPFVRGLLSGTDDPLFLSQSTYDPRRRPAAHAREVQELLGCPVACGIGYTDCELDDPAALSVRLRRALGGRLKQKRHAWLYRAGCDGHPGTSDPFRHRADAPELLAAVYAEALRPVRTAGRKRKRRH